MLQSTTSDHQQQAKIPKPVRRFLPRERCAAMELSTKSSEAEKNIQQLQIRAYHSPPTAARQPSYPGNS